MSSARTGSGTRSRLEPTWIDGAGFSKVERLGSNGRERFSRSVAAAGRASGCADEPLFSSAGLDATDACAAALTFAADGVGLGDSSR